MTYHHLTQEERYQIYAFRRANFSIRQIAEQLGRHPSTICRELRRNIHRKGYRPKMAHHLAGARAQQARSRLRITAKQWLGISKLLGQLWRKLRRAGLHRRQYHRSRSHRTPIRFRVGIEHRPSEVESRTQLGHWEGDTILGGGRQGSVLTLVERKSRCLRMGVLPERKARTVSRIARYRLHQISARVHSITLDKGSEFVCHPRMARSLSTDIYFAEPYKPWQRGSNENTNGLIRQYLPKKMSLKNLTQVEADRIENRLNHRPRKCLDYLTPFEVFNNTRETLTVALRG